MWYMLLRQSGVCLDVCKQLAYGKQLFQMKLGTGESYWIDNDRALIASWSAIYTTDIYPALDLCNWRMVIVPENTRPFLCYILNGFIQHAQGIIAVYLFVQSYTVDVIFTLSYLIIYGYEIVDFVSVWSCVHHHTCWSWEEK